MVKKGYQNRINSASGRLIITTDADCTMGKELDKNNCSLFYENTDLI